MRSLNVKLPGGAHVNRRGVLMIDHERGVPLEKLGIDHSDAVVLIDASRGLLPAEDKLAWCEHHIQRALALASLEGAEAGLLFVCPKFMSWSTMQAADGKPLQLTGVNATGYMLVYETRDAFRADHPDDIQPIVMEKDVR